MLDGDAWGEDGEYYYNDRPGAKPPSPVQGEPQVQESNTPASILMLRRQTNIHIEPLPSVCFIESSSSNFRTVKLKMFSLASRRLKRPKKLHEM